MLTFIHQLQPAVHVPADFMGGLGFRVKSGGCLRDHRTTALSVQVQAPYTYPNIPIKTLRQPKAPYMSPTLRYGNLKPHNENN